VLAQVRVLCGRVQESQKVALIPFTMLITLLLAATTTVHAKINLKIDFYRVLTGASVDKNKWEDNDFTDLMASLFYLQTEIIPDSLVGETDPATGQPRQARKYNADAVASWRWQVNNDGNSDQVDFGPYTAYDFGQNTASANDQFIDRFGDYIGVQNKRVDNRFKTFRDHWWFSATGPCPNLPFVTEKASVPPSGRCQQDFPGQDCPGKWLDDGKTFNPNCMKYQDKSDYVQGGLCKDSTITSPTGDKGCTYMYGNSTVVYLDNLVGIPEEDCGGRKCKDWSDFRYHCTNDKYKYRFDATNPQNPGPKKVSFCVEYDIHPACKDDCGKAACLNVPIEQRELGIPFWSGRCDPKQNEMRAEKMAVAFGIKDGDTSHNLVKADLRKQDQPCLQAGNPQSAQCQPNLNTPGPYCTRTWGGVCDVCLIPNTDKPSPDPNHPFCPFDILDSIDYKSGQAPGCRTRDAKDWCCLYSHSCQDMTSDPEKLPLDENGLQMARYMANTSGMKVFLNRLAKDKYGGVPADSDTITQFAYWEWHLSPTSYLMARNVSMVAQEYSSFISTPAPTPAPAPTPGGKGKNDHTGLIIALVIVALVLIGGVVGLVVWRKRVANARNLPGAQMTEPLA